MMDGALAAGIVVILAFVVFIVWAKSASGRNMLRNSLGEPHGYLKRNRYVKKHSSPPTGSAKKGATTKRSSR